MQTPDMKKTKQPPSFIRKREEEAERKRESGGVCSGKRYRKRRGKARRSGRRIVRKVLLLGLVAVMVLLVLEKNLESVILSMAQARVQAMAVDRMNDSVREALSGQKVYDELVTVRTDENGNVTMIQADAVRMNELATMTALLAQEKLAHAEHETVTIPLGAALGIPFFAAMGPGVQVRLVPVGAVTAEFLSEFESAGINQTRHKIFLSMRTTVRLVLPRGAEQVSFNSQVLIAESIIVGQVPDSFIEVQSSDQALNFAP